MLGKDQSNFFISQGYLVLRSFLSDDDITILTKRCRHYAPDPALIEQYAQEDDKKRFEYSLSQALPDEVRAKRKLDGKEGDEMSETSPFQLPVLSAVVNELCRELVPAEAFCIVSEPGSRDQVPHTDSIPMEGQSDESWLASLHYIGLLVPLQDTNEQVGQTAVVPKSHLNPCLSEETRLSMNLGDVLVLDGRTTHRGLANTQSPKEEERVRDDDDITSGTRTTLAAVSARPPPRKICFLTFTLPGVADGNALAYTEHEKVSDKLLSNSEETQKKKVKVI